MRRTRDEYMMRLAEVAAGQTTCVRRGVGCVLADGLGRVLAVAYNGVAAGAPHCNRGWAIPDHRCQGYDLPPGKDGCEAVHAEQNALLQCRRPDDVVTAYVTLSPCKACAKLFVNLPSCHRIVFREEHSLTEAKGIWLGSRAGREWVRLPPQPLPAQARRHSMTSKDDISRWFDNGVVAGATHMIVVCDTFDHEDYPRYAAGDADCLRKYEQARGESMQRVMEVYDLRQDKKAQLAEHRAMRLPKEA